MVIFLLRVLARQLLGLLDVTRLGGLVTTEEQQHVVAAVLKEVHPVARSMVDLQLRHSLADGLNSPQVSKGQAPDSDVNASTCRSILQRGEPLLILGV